MAKRQSRYVCQACGAQAPKWSGRCESCGAWNAIVEEALPQGTPGGLGAGPAGAGGRAAVFDRLDATPERGPALPRMASGIGEFDRVCGGGLIPGSAVLIGGDPGIGKSTVLLQAAAMLARGKAGPPVTCAYVSGEESIDQIRLRAARLGLADAPVALAAATSVREILAGLEAGGGAEAAVVIIDSIQTMFLDSLESAPGTVAQVRGSAQELIRLAKQRGFTLLLVGHVTKEGLIAGPKVLEHMVDTVLAFEGERGHQFRILRAVKNRFGPTDEIGVFEMSDAGLIEVENPSALFLTERQGEVTGACVFAGIEGTRPILVEVQALVSASPLATPRRAVVGWDQARLAMVLAVLESRCGLSFAGRDVYLNVVGGLRLSEPAADLAMAAAIVSAAGNQAVPADCILFGEIGLSGEVRPVGRSDLRLKEAAKLGFARAFAPPAKPRKGGGQPALEVETMGHVADLVARIGAPVRDNLVRHSG